MNQPDPAEIEAIAARAEAASTLREGPLDTFMRHAHTDILALLAALAESRGELSDAEKALKDCYALLPADRVVLVRTETDAAMTKAMNRLEAPHEST